MIKELYTIGYQGKTINVFIGELKNKNVELLVDARIHTGGRKLDFCKKNLQEHLNKAGIEYVHYKKLGTPEHLMKIMKEDGHYSLSEYSTYLEANSEILDQVAKEVQQSKVAIMCYEKNYWECHRSVVADHLAKKIKSPLFHI